MKPQAYRNLVRLTLKEMAEKLGIAVSYLSMIEAGHRRPSPDLAKKMMEVSDGAITLEDALFDSRYRTPKQANSGEPNG